MEETRVVFEDDKDRYKRLKHQLCALEDGLINLKTRAKKLSGLSRSTENQLTDLEDRIVRLRNEFHPPSSSSSKSLPSGWERRLTDDRIPYYLNHVNETTQWNHPVYEDLINSLLDMNSVRYSVYRLTLKLRKIQRRLCLDSLDVESVAAEFTDFLGLTTNDSLIAVPEMEAILNSLMKAEIIVDDDVDLCVDLTLNWLLDVYDPSRLLGGVRVLAFKVGILTLAGGPLTDKYRFLYDLVADPETKLLDPPSLGSLLHDCLQIPKALGEVASFGGSNVEPSIRSCFENSNKINKAHFHRWVWQEPQCLVWLPVLHRLIWAELAKHNIKCKICKSYPMIGFRYHCLKCFNFDLCHNCFFLTRESKSHRSNHPMKEYCTSTGTSVNLKNFTSSLRNSFRTKKYFKKKSKQLGYLPVQSVLEDPNLSATDAIRENPKKSSHRKDEEEEEDEHSLIAKYCRMLRNDVEVHEEIQFDEKDLERLIESLEDENRRLMTELLKYSEVEIEAKACKRMETRIKILEDHNSQLDAKLQRLRQLLLDEDFIFESNKSSAAQFHS